MTANLDAYAFRPTGLQCRRGLSPPFPCRKQILYCQYGLCSILRLVHKGILRSHHVFHVQGYDGGGGKRPAWFASVALEF